MIPTGTKLGRYEIRSLIGVGGMGEVYRASDPKIGRDVAIKVLPADFSADKERVARFEQEAQAAGALNHPNILAIYDVDTQDDILYVVSELLEGEELRQRLDEGTIPLRKVTEYAQQIVSGLSAAHEKGIVHRDLKPENLFITKDDRVKILDFGLAKLSEPGAVATGSEDATKRALTNPGVVMGTVGYMSPEQVRGHATDHRSDIFSFGLILYEMITGRRAFQEESLAETMSAIVKEEPPEMTESNPNISPSLERIVRRCLEKKPERRFQSTSDLGFALESLSAPTSSSGNNMTTAATAEVSESEKSVWRGRRPWIAAAVAVVVALTALPFAIKYLRQPPPAESPAVRFTIALSEKAITFAPAVSPDGRNLVFNAVIEGRPQLWLRPLGSFTARPLPGTEGSSGYPFWSPDSRWIGFLAQDKLKKVDLADGTQQTLCNVPGSGGAFGGTWNREGTILFARSGIIYRVSAAGGEPVPVPGLEGSRQGVTYAWPYFLPDGSHFLYLATAAQQGASEVYLASLDGKEPKRLLSANSSAIYVASSPAATAASGGYLLFGREGALLAQPFDVSSLSVTGEPFRVADQMRVINRGEFSVSDTGTLVYDPSGTDENQQLTWFDRVGKRLEAVGEAGTFSSPSLSPEGKRVVVTHRNPKTRTDDIYVIDLARGTSSPLTFDPADDQYPVWSPEGSRIAWRSNREGTYQLYQKLASGVGPEELLLKSDVRIGFHSWSADGRFILNSWLDPKTRGDIGVLPLAGDRKPFVFLQTPFSEREALFSPDGRWVAYISNESGRNEVYVQTFPASSDRWPVSTKGGDYPRWRGDGKELFYVSSDGKMMAVEVKTGSTFEPGIPKALFDLSASVVKTTVGGYAGYAVTADGQRFLFVSQGEETASSSLAVVVNWTADLKK